MSTNRRGCNMFFRENGESEIKTQFDWIHESENPVFVRNKEGEFVEYYTKRGNKKFELIIGKNFLTDNYLKEI